MIEVWKDWKDFVVLPDKGDLLDQEAWVYDVINHCETVSRGVRAELENKNMKEMDQSKTALERKIAAKRGAI